MQRCRLLGLYDELWKAFPGSCFPLTNSLYPGWWWNLCESLGLRCECRLMQPGPLFEIALWVQTDAAQTIILIQIKVYSMNSYSCVQQSGSYLEISVQHCGSYLKAVDPELFFSNLRSELLDKHLQDCAHLCFLLLHSFLTSIISFQWCYLLYA